MPANGEVNTREGLYANLCCAIELIIEEGADFPDCPNHPKLTTVWKPAEADKILRLKNENAKPDNAA